MELAPYDGDWLSTYSGKVFHPISPRVDEVCIVDIAHALSLQCRYAGHVSSFYSTGEHCVHIANYLPEEYKLWGLLHDAAEAYLVDIPRPLKRYLPDYRAIEQRVMFAICEHFGLRRMEPPEVKDADDRIIENERRVLLAPNPLWSHDRAPLPGVTIECWTPAQSEQHFLAAFFRLGGTVNYWR
jgi:hypothetical protein